MDFISLYRLLEKRKAEMPPESGTTLLFMQGLPPLLEKLNEESFEVALALEAQSADDVALEVSQCFYFLFCLSVYLGEQFDGIDLKSRLGDIQDKHDLSKRLCRSVALVCHTPCLGSINRMPPLLIEALDLGGSSKQAMFEYL